LHDDVDRAALQLGQAQPEAVPVELLPRHAGLDRHVLVADAAVTGDQVEVEPARVASLDLAELRGDQVVVEQPHWK